MDESLKKIVDETRRSNRAYDERLEQLVARAMDEIPNMVAEIKRIDPDVSRVVLFGSLATNTVRSVDFDIDLAISSEEIFKIAAWSEDQDLPIDIVDIDALSPNFRRVVEEKGTVLYEKAL